VWFEGAVDVHGEWMVVAVSVTVRGGVRRGAGEGTIGSRLGRGGDCTGGGGRLDGGVGGG
jgi:hypothetical protein